jgi:hypothetical protein
MADEVPTQIGDVLILYNNSNPTHAVGAVSEDSQQTLNANLKYERGRPAAVAAARSLVMPGCRIFFKNTDTGEWAKLS